MKHFPPFLVMVIMQQLLFQYHQPQIDITAQAQANAVLCYFGIYDGLEESWCKRAAAYQAKALVNRWRNGRERGYVISMRSENGTRQINIAFYEHRNSDAICAVVWHQYSDTPIEYWEDAVFPEDVYTDKYDVTHSVGWGQAKDMATWIYDVLEEFWTEDKIYDVDVASAQITEYLHEYIDMMAPVTPEKQIEVYKDKGYVPNGHNGKNFPNFEAWKKIRK